VDGLIEETTSLVRFLWRGTLPALLDIPDQVVPDYFRSYMQTYVERDVRLMEDIRELVSFGRFLGLTGALTAREVNASQFGRDVGVTPATSRKWLDLLVNTYQWLELFPYQGSAFKRLSGKRKGFLRDTGMACYLQRISSLEALGVSPMLGAMFETWAVNEVLRQCITLTVPPRAYHWRTGGGAEVDLILERDGKLYPMVKGKSHHCRESPGSTSRGVSIAHAVAIRCSVPGEFPLGLSFEWNRRLPVASAGGKAASRRA
jgi:predicted AAA+ superfamily ATPase